MLTNSDKVNSSSLNAITELNAHTSKTWAVKECDFSRVVLVCGDVYIEHLLTTSSFVAELTNSPVEELRSQYHANPVKAYEDLKERIKGVLEDIQEIYNGL